MIERTSPWQRPGSRVFEHLVVFSLPVALFVILGFLIEGFLEGTLPRVLNVTVDVVYWLLIASLYTCVWAAVRFVRRVRPDVLATPIGFTASEAWMPIVLWSLAAYVTIGMVLGAAAYVLVPKTDHHWPLVVLGFSVSLPLFLAVPIGSLVAWHRVNREAARDRAAG